MLRKAAFAILLSAGLALCQGGLPQPATSDAHRETPLRELTAINQAAMIYYSWLKRVPTSIKQLGPSDRKVADATAADLISSDLASGIYKGYRFTLTGSNAGWTVRAVPLSQTGGAVQATYTVESRITPKAKQKSATPKQ